MEDTDKKVTFTVNDDKEDITLDKIKQLYEDSRKRKDTESSSDDETDDTQEYLEKLIDAHFLLTQSHDNLVKAYLKSLKNCSSPLRSIHGDDEEDTDEEEDD